MKKEQNVTKTMILLAGILVGFLIGRVTWSTMIPEEPENVATVGTGVRMTSENQPLPQTSSITPKGLDEIKGISTDDDVVIGSADAQITIVEFTDYQCPFCKRYFDDTFGRIRADYVDTGKVRYVVRDFPLDEHPQALPAANAAECAGEQGKYLEMHDKLFSGQDDWSYNNDALLVFKTYGADLGLNAAAFENCLKTGKYESEISKDISDGITYAVTSTPTFFVNDRKIVGAQSYGLFKKVIDEELAKQESGSTMTAI